MADKRISELTDVSTPSSSASELPLLDAGATRALSLENLSRWLHNTYYVSTNGVSPVLTGVYREVYYRFQVNSGNFLVTGQYPVFRISISGTGFIPKIIGGDYQTNTASGRWATVLGGQSNHVGGNSSAIVGGTANDTTTDAIHGFIGGGSLNSLHSDNGIIAGGRLNHDSGISYNAILGGYTNRHGDQTQNSVICGGSFGVTEDGGDGNFIGGGGSNRIRKAVIASTIVGGLSNNLSGSYATIGGGRENTLTGNYGTIAGGYRNFVSTVYGTIGGGFNNRFVIDSPVATIAGGESNWISGAYSTIGGGWSNSGQFNYTFIGGGIFNKIYAPLATICGGTTNRISGFYGFIGGGVENYIGGNIYSTVVGGRNNSGEGGYGFVGGGFLNVINSNSFWATIGGGHSNVISGASSSYGFIGGGFNNKIGSFDGTTQSLYSAIIGGTSNQIHQGNYSVVGGFDNHTSGLANFVISYQSNATGSSNCIFGGTNNHIWGVQTLETIVGGNINTIRGGTSSSIFGGTQGTLSGDYSSIVGGQINTLLANRSVMIGTNNSFCSGGYSLVFGNMCEVPVVHSGSVLFGDSRNVKKYSAGANTVTFDFISGVVLNTGNLVLNMNYRTPVGGSSSQGRPGEIAVDSQYIYVCVSANTWRRADLFSF
jgi:hypothetical protein